MNIRNRILLCIVVLVAVVVVASFRYGQRTREYGSDQFLMDTLISIKVYGNDTEIMKKAVAAAYAEMRRIAELADGFQQPGTATCSSSDVCRINAMAGKQPVQVDADIMAMLLLAKKFGELSEGALDVTVGPLMELWGFGGSNPHLPSPDLIRATLPIVNSKDLLLDAENRSAFLRRAGMKLDLGAIAKGYATEKALQILAKHGIRKALIDAGGNIRVLGKNRQNAPWRIGIKDPRKKDVIVAVLQLEDASAVTSGDYYRSFEAGGKRYHHILDPRSGYPADRNMSVTVVTKDAGLADTLSTVFFVLPEERALEMAGKMPGVDLLLITADGRIRHTPHLKGRLEMKSGGAYRYDQGR